MSLTDFVSRETRHLTPVIIDGLIWVLVPTLTAFNIGMEKLATQTRVTSADWCRVIVETSIVALTALGSFRSQAYGRWKSESKAREATDFVPKPQPP